MITSALAFQQLLAIASSHRPLDTRFLSALADHLEFSGVDAEVQVASILLKMVDSIETDIKNLPIEEYLKEELLKKTNVFMGIKNLGHIHMDLANAKKHFLKDENLVGLISIHIALAGKIEHPTIDRSNASKLADKFRNLSAEVKIEDLPPDLKRALMKRSMQMASILDNFYAFSADDLQQEIDGLVGAMVLRPQPKGSPAARLYGSIAALTVASLGILTATDTSMEKVISIKANATMLINMIGEKEDNAKNDTPQNTESE
jgi:hypothetical protein